MDFVRTTFEGSVVILDGCNFIRCVFRRCEIIYRGASFGLESCDFDNCNYNFQEAAGRTLEFLHMLGQGPEGRKLVEQIFDGSAPVNRTVN